MRHAAGRCRHGWGVGRRARRCTTPVAQALPAAAGVDAPAPVQGKRGIRGGEPGRTRAGQSGDQRHPAVPANHDGLHRTLVRPVAEVAGRDAEDKLVRVRRAGAWTSGPMPGEALRHGHLPSPAKAGSGSSHGVNPGTFFIALPGSPATRLRPAAVGRGHRSAYCAACSRPPGPRRYDVATSPRRCRRRAAVVLIDHATGWRIIDHREARMVPEAGGAHAPLQWTIAALAFAAHLLVAARALTRANRTPASRAAWVPASPPPQIGRAHV